MFFMILIPTTVSKPAFSYEVCMKEGVGGYFKLPASRGGSALAVADAGMKGSWNCETASAHCREDRIGAATTGSSWTVTLVS